MNLDLPAPLSNAADLLAALRPKIERITLAAPVLGATLRAPSLVQQRAAALSLFEPQPRAERALPRLVAELVSDLGPDAVAMLTVGDSWGPDERSKLVPFGSADAKAAAALMLAKNPKKRRKILASVPEPTRYLAEPRPVAKDDARIVRHLSRVEAIEWWKPSAERSRMPTDASPARLRAGLDGRRRGLRRNRPSHGRDARPRLVRLMRARADPSNWVARGLETMPPPRFPHRSSTRMPYEGDSARAETDIGLPLAPEFEALRASIAARQCRYVELSARTNFSFLSGATPPEYLVFRAAELGYNAIAITDRDGIYGIVRAVEEAQKHGVRVIVGCELTLEREGIEGLPEVPGKPMTITVLVENREGYTNLCKILTASHARHPKNIPLKRTDNLDDEDLPRNTWAGIPLADIAKHANGLWALIDAMILDEPAGQLAIRAFGPRLSVPIHLHKDGEDRARVFRAETALRKYGLAICATNRVLYARPQDKPILDVLHCIREGKTLDEAGRELGPNVEAHLKSEEEMTRLFSLHPEWIARSRFIAERCLFSIKELKYNFPYEISDLVHRDFRHPDGTGRRDRRSSAPSFDVRRRALALGRCDSGVGRGPNRERARRHRDIEGRALFLERPRDRRHGTAPRHSLPRPGERRQ